VRRAHQPLHAASIAMSNDPGRDTGEQYAQDEYLVQLR